MESVRRTVQTAYKSPALGPYSRSYGLGWARDPPEETQLLKVLCRLPVTVTRGSKGYGLAGCCRRSERLPWCLLWLCAVEGASLSAHAISVW